MFMNQNFLLILCHTYSKGCCLTICINASEIKNNRLPNQEKKCGIFFPLSYYMELQGQKNSYRLWNLWCSDLPEQKKKKFHVALWILITNPTGGFL